MPISSMFLMALQSPKPINPLLIFSYRQAKVIQVLFYRFLKAINKQGKRILKHTGFMLLCAAFVLLAAAPAKADGDYVSLFLGEYDVFDDHDALDCRAEYRWSEPLFWQISPYAGLEITADGTVWGGVGLYSDFFVTDHTYITPSFAIGLYNQGGSDLDLDYPLEFRSQIEIGYQFENYHRISLGLSHTSNGSLGNHNPGTEVLGIYYHIPW